MAENIGILIILGGGALGILFAAWWTFRESD